MKKYFSIKFALFGVLAVLGSGSAPVQAYTIFPSSPNPIPAEDLKIGSNSNPPLLPSTFDSSLTPSVQFPGVPNSNAEETRFLSSLTDPGIENFEAYTGQPLSNTQTLDLTFKTSSGREATGTVIGTTTLGDIRLNTGFERGAYNTTETDGSSNYIFALAEIGQTDRFGIRFDEDVSAFGFSANDVSDFGATVQLVLFNDGIQIGSPIPVTATLGANGSTSSSTIFFGVSADNDAEAFDAVEFDLIGGVGGGGDTFGFDDMIIEFADTTPRPPSTTTPEPSALIGLGLLGTVSFVFRRKNR